MSVTKLQCSLKPIWFGQRGLVSSAKNFCRGFAASNQEQTTTSVDADHTHSPLPSSTLSSDGDNDETHFGFKTVNKSEKANKVHKVFEDVASSYDLMNDAMSLGIQRLWKDAFIASLGPTKGSRLLDLAGGTGDIAFRYLKYVNNLPIESEYSKPSHVTISDINQHMLNVGKMKAQRLGYASDQMTNGNTIDWICANAEQLPFDDNSFTACTIAFGLRNCTNISKVLGEAYRILKPGGRFMCLEFSHLTNSTLQKLYDQYSFQVIPPMGQILVGQWDAYQYLVESIRRFPCQEELKRLFEEAGFKLVVYENLTFGIVAIHSGFKF